MDLESSRRGTDDAFGRDLEACRNYLTLVAERLIPTTLRTKLAASDLVQETFVDARRRFDDLRTESLDDLRAWLYGVMLMNLAEQKRKFLDTAKSDVRREVALDGSPENPGRQVADGRPTPSTVVAGRERLAWLAHALAELPAVERQVVHLRYREDLPYDEIGRRLDGRTPDAARMLFNRACHRLYRILKGRTL
jgi:RNA polymerase sigma-70 factor (ECF subfamily)